MPAEAKLPYLDPDIEHVGLSKLRLLNNRTLRDLKRPLLLQAPVTNEPLAVLVSYKAYLELQRIILLAAQMGILE